MKNVDGQTDVGHINLIGGLVTRNPPKTDIFQEIAPKSNLIAPKSNLIV